ncbi:MAG: hypothetical protein M3352_06100 [Bacteroidota bacterium]|nr:hypothetical protein [Bacteroidota bacterium]
MKKIFFLLSIFSFLCTHAQFVSGLYSGTLVNDSTKKIQQYEFALSEYRDKITGYSYTTFVVNDTFYYSIKRVKATKKDNQLIIEDDKMLANNFPESPAKRVKQTSTIILNTTDTLRNATGKWTTNQTKVYYSLHGLADTKRNNDSSRSALIGHLKELKIINPNATQTGTVKIIKPDDNQKIKKPSVKTASVKVKQSTSNISTATPYELRKNKMLETIIIQSDSLVLSFYDNGVVDGDVISVYVNGQNMISNARLTEAAIKKTIHFTTTNNDSIQLTLTAENLGSLPPNTGLVVIQDGENKYQIHFSADLQTNATIVFRKRRN